MQVRGGVVVPESSHVAECSELVEKARLARAASYELGLIDTGTKNRALESMAEALLDASGEILNANRRDVEAARSGGANPAFIDRLSLNEKRIRGMAEGLRDVVKLPDPVGEVVASWTRPNGLRIEKVRVPLGVVAIIYEARPNVTSDAVGLTLKSGNSVILKGGSSAINSNAAIVEVLDRAARESGIPAGAINFIESTERDSVHRLLKLREYIDVVIPRGGAGLINMVVENSTIPVIETGTGNCHVYVDESADIDMARDIIVNAKTQRPAVCNAAETLLVHKDIAASFLPEAGKALSTRGVELRACPRAMSYLPGAKAATEEDWGTEFLDLVLAVKVVSSLDEAIEHIQRYGTRHSEAIVTRDEGNAREFLDRVDAAAVYVNASTRFTDGGEFGFGAEIGISTQKLHARGPMGLPELTSIKYKVYGNGQIRG
ncbi:MAG: glutamate-5-semialdehyde dehydrogenase [Firmicutes bacterium]|nr:glutamate-5-semialdehyde dehydrogenase [Bacillota bacterium]